MEGNYIVMFRYSTIYINLVSFFITLIIFLFGEYVISNYDTFTKKSSLRAGFQVENISNEIAQENVIQEDTNEEEKETKENWQLEIPKINLKAPISEGTTSEVMDDYIGHFEETSKDLGNIGLAAHNRGYKNNYFRDLKQLQENDEIYYTHNGKTRKYVVTKSIIIKDTDWTYLEETQENTITLITCVENQPEYRRCIQGEEKN